MSWASSLPLQRIFATGPIIYREYDTRHNTLSTRLLQYYGTAVLLYLTYVRCVLLCGFCSVLLLLRLLRLLLLLLLLSMSDSYRGGAGGEGGPRQVPL